MENTGLGIECALKGILYNKRVSRKGWPIGDFISINPDKGKDILYYSVSGRLTWSWIPTFDDLYAEDYYKLED